jgi:hypothetical protein
VFVASFSKRRRGEVEGGYHYGGKGRVNRSFLDGEGLEPRFEGVRIVETLAFCFSGFRYLRSTEDFREATDLV